MEQIPKRLAEIQVRYSHKVSKREKPQVKTSAEAFSIFSKIWNDELIAYQEAFVALYLNRANRLMGYRCISTGSTVGTTVDAKHVFAIAVKVNASSIIIAHNHPSSNIYPSQADIALTKKLVDGGKLLDINVLDHLIIIPEYDYYSFADEGRI